MTKITMDTVNSWKPPETPIAEPQQSAEEIHAELAKTKTELTAAYERLNKTYDDHFEKHERILGQLYNEFPSTFPSFKKYRTKG
jgi:hypothetical protein